MGEVLLNAFALFMVIIFGYLMKRVNILSKADGTTLSLIILNITLPAAVITNLSTLTIDTGLLLLVAVGFIFNVIMVFSGSFFGKNEEESSRKFLMYTASGYNIGNFALPFMQSFLPAAVPFLALFDVGNSIMLAGGTTMLIDRIEGQSEKFSPFNILKRLFSSVPFTTYVVMLVIRLLSISLPAPVLAITGIMGSANTFLSMFMIGLYLELFLPRKFQKIVLKVLGVRYGIGILMAVIIFILPLPSMMTTVLCLLCLGPIATFGVINSVKSGMKEEAVGFASSISFIISFALMTGALMILL